MTTYLIHFNQQWVGDHPEEWFRERGPLANAVVEDMKAAGVYVFAGGLEDIDTAFSADATSGTLSFRDGPYRQTGEFVGGLTIVDVPDEEAARLWAGRLAEACGWPQEVRRITLDVPVGGSHVGTAPRLRPQTSQRARGVTSLVGLMTAPLSVHPRDDEGPLISQGPSVVPLNLVERSIW